MYDFKYYLTNIKKNDNLLPLKLRQHISGSNWQFRSLEIKTGIYYVYYI